jgi:cell shape-determining protein MreC
MAFQRRSELEDAARNYRTLKAQLDPKNDNSQLLSSYYTEEGKRIEEEIRKLDN